jgi:polysaccharide pyruvyl transferase WcaK-like protein
MRILLLYAWGNANAGDKALALGTVEILRRCFPKSTIDVVSMYARENRETEASREYLAAGHPDVRVICDDLRPLAKLPHLGVVELVRNLLLVIGLLCPTVLRLLCRKSKVLATLQQADLILLNGGHLLFWSDRMGQKQRILWKYLLPLMLARRLGKSYGLHAQSFGPFEFSKKDWLFRRAFRYVLEGADYLSVRESASLPHLKTCLGNIDRVKCVLDSAFFLTEQDDRGAAALLERHGLARERFLAITLRLSKRGSKEDLPPELHESYTQKIVEFVSLWTRNETIPLVFSCQVPKDVEDTEFILSRLSDAERGKCIVLEHTPSPELLVALYANAAAVVGMRFHSLIFALVAKAPVMGVYYYDIGPKIKGVMEDLGYPQYALSLAEAAGSQLYQAASDLLAHADAVSSALADKVSSLKSVSLEAILDRTSPDCEAPSRSERPPNADIRVCHRRGQNTSANCPVHETE